jgi:hypothetical protein
LRDGDMLDRRLDVGRLGTRPKEISDDFFAGRTNSCAARVMMTCTRRLRS